MPIGYVRIPHFAIAVARRDNPTLAEHPLLLIEEGTGHATVYAGCEQALACGVQPGMRLARAQRLCPEAHLAPATESIYLAAFEDCLDTLSLFAPRVEPEGLGGAYLDLDDLIHSPDDGADLFRQLAPRLQRDQHLTAAMGVTATMFGAALAGTYMRPGFGVTFPSGIERGFLAPFPTRVLPVGDEMVRRLQLLGLREIGQYADLPSGVILNQFGWEGQRACLPCLPDRQACWHRQAHRLAQGRDDRRVRPSYRRTPGRPRLIETAGHGFEDPIAGAAVLAAARDRLVSRLLDRIRDHYLAPQAVYVQLEFEDGPARGAHVILPAPTADAGELQRAAGRLTQQIPIRNRVTDVQVSLGKLQPLVGRQLTLFPTQADQERQLRQLVAHLARRYGDGFRQPQVVDAGALILERRFILSCAIPRSTTQNDSNSPSQSHPHVSF